MKITGEQVRAGRELIRWRQNDLAKAASVSLPTIKRIEAIRGQISANVTTVNSIFDAFTKAGIEFIQENGGGPGVRLKK